MGLLVRGLRLFGLGWKVAVVKGALHSLRLLRFTAVMVAILFRPYLLFLGGAAGIIYGLHVLGVLPVIDVQPVVRLLHAHGVPLGVLP